MSSIQMGLPNVEQPAPRVTPDDLEAEIASEHYFTAGDAAYPEAEVAQSEAASYDALRLLTICVLVLRNGYTVTGESACVSPENFDAQMGREIARGKAVAKLWPLLGFRLADEVRGRDD